MRRFFLGLTSVLASASLMFGVASAASSDCSLVNTGPNSNNTCTVTDSNNLKVTCTNSADVVFVNNQSTNSGNATLEKNTNGGYAYSGNAVNTNSTTGNLDVSCGAKTASSPSPAPSPTPAPVAAATPSATPPAASGGSGQAQPQAAPKAQALPETGSNGTVAAVAIAASVLGVAATAARLGFSAYRHMSLR
jgi:hypothetical protein